MILTPGQVSLAELEIVWRSDEPISLAGDVRGPIDAAAAIVRRAAEGNEAIYGVNTGFGKLANVTIAADDTAALQRNLVLSHCCGVGEVLDTPTTRLMMVLKLLSLARGASGVVWETAALLMAMVNKACLLYTSPSPRDVEESRMPSSA